jgi:hypothetical protein
MSPRKGASAQLMVIYLEGCPGMAFHPGDADVTGKVI